MADPYDDALEAAYEGAREDKTSHPENLLQRAAKSIKSSMGMGGSGENPFMRGISSTMSGMKGTPGMGPYMVGHDMKNEVAEGHPLLNAISEPEVWVAGGGAQRAIPRLSSMAQEGIQSGIMGAGKIFKSGKSLRNVDARLGQTAQDIQDVNQAEKTGSSYFKKEERAQAGAVKKEKKNVLKDMGQKFKTNRESKMSQLSQESQSMAGAAKEKIAGVSKDNSTLYRQEMESAEPKKAIMSDEYYKEVIQPAIDHIESQGIRPGPAYQRLKGMAEKYGPPPSAATGETDMLGLAVKAEPEPPVNFDLNELKNIKNSMYEDMGMPAQQGFAQHRDKDLSNDIFQFYHRNFLKNRAPEFQALQEEYAPMIRAQHFGHEEFRPQTEEIDRGSNLLQKAAQGKASPDDASMLERLQKGSGPFKGTGDLTGKTGSIQESIQILDKNFKGDKDAYLKAVEDRLAKIKEESAASVGGVKSGARGKRDNLLARQGTLQERKKELEHLHRIRNWIVAGAAGAAGAAVLGNTGRFLGHTVTRTST